MGWAYGFPKIYDKDIDGDMTEWLRKQGLPEELIKLGHIRMWEAK